MDSTRPGILERVSGWLGNILVLSTLAGLGWWGHEHHWSFASAHEHGGKDALASAAVSGSPDQKHLPEPAFGELPSVTFGSAEGARNCGIVTASVGCAAMDDVVRAHGVAGYDETRLAQLSVRVPGTVSKVEKRLGDHVKRGDALVVVDSADVGDAKARLLEACVTYDLKTKNFERLTSIKNTIAARELIEAEAALDLSRTQRFNALQKLINLGFELNLSEIESRSPDEVHQKLHLLGLPESFDAETASDNLIPVKAPFDGVVTHCEVVRGEMAEPAKSLYVLADTRRMWIRINLRPDDIDRVAAGSTVTFESESRQRPVTGTLTWIGTEIDPHTRTVQARAEVDNPLLHEGDDEAEGMRLLQAGAYGEAQVVVRQQPMAVVIPDEALRFQWEIGNEIVFIASEDGRTFSPRVVQKGLARDGSVQIVKGLEAGEKIVTLGSRVLSAELSDRLQEKLGDNAEAVRTFHHAHETAGPG